MSGGTLGRMVTFVQPRPDEAALACWHGCFSIRAMAHSWKRTLSRMTLRGFS